MPTTSATDRIKGEKFIDDEDLLTELVVRLFFEPQNADGFNLSTLKSKIKKSFGLKLSETAFGATKMIELFHSTAV